MYIACFEWLKDRIHNRVQRHFWCGFDESGDQFDPRCRSEVLAPNKSPLYASLDWLREHGAIDDSDIRSFELVKKLRNDLGHELLDLLLSRGLPEDLDTRFRDMLVLLRKTEVWWITNFDMPSDPQFDGQGKVTQDLIDPGPCMLMRLFVDTACGDLVQSRESFDLLKRAFDPGPRPGRG